MARFLRVCSSIKSERLEQLFLLLLTAEEREQLADRVSLIHALLCGDETQREISKRLHISIAKITRGSNQLKTTDKELKTLLLALLDRRH